MNSSIAGAIAGGTTGQTRFFFGYPLTKKQARLVGTIAFILLVYLLWTLSQPVSETAIRAGG